MIIFKKIRFKNFLSYGNQWTEITLDKNNTTLIVGKNGAGKSTFLDALSFVLFGKSFRKINKPQLVNSITQKGAVVETEFEIKSSKYKIIRGLKPTIFEIYQDGKMLDQTALSDDYQNYFEKHILKVNHKSFCQIVVLGTASFQPFMQLSTPARREIIEDILNLKIFSIMNGLNKEKILLNTEALNCNSADKRVVEEKIKMTKNHMESLRQNNEQIINEKLELIRETETNIFNLIVQINESETKINDISLKLKSENTIRNNLIKIKEYEISIKNKMNTLKSEIEFFNEHDNCPTCKQGIPHEFKSEIISDKPDQISKYKDALIKLKSNKVSIEDNIKKFDEITRQILLIQKNVNNLISEKNGLVRYKEKLEYEINVKPMQIKEDCSLEILEDELKEIVQEYNKLIEIKKNYNLASQLLKDDGIKSKHIKKYIPEINKLINKYLAAMEFMCEFTLNEEFEETIKSRFRDDFSYSSFSEGEKFRINLAILFAWRAIAKKRNSISTNILIMDEVMDSSLDSAGTDEFVKLIKTLTNDTNTFIISHKTDQLVDKFDHVIVINKVKNFSRIV